MKSSSIHRVIKPIHLKHTPIVKVEHVEFSIKEVEDETIEEEVVSKKVSKKQKADTTTVVEEENNNENKTEE